MFLDIHRESLFTQTFYNPSVTYATFLKASWFKDFLKNEGLPVGMSECV